MYLKFLFIGMVLLLNQFTSSLIIKYQNKEPEDTYFKTDENNEIPRYQVTENVIDIPDDRTLAPIVPNFGINLGLNYGNTTVKQNKTIIDKEEKWNKEESNPNSEVANIVNKPTNEDKLNKDKGNNLKKNQFSILHIKAEYENDHKVENTNDKCNHVFRCLKEYLYGVKKGFVDGIHSFLNRRKDTHTILDTLHRNIDSDDSNDSDEVHSFSDEFGDDYAD